MSAPARVLTASFSRRRMRFRAAALPTFFVTVRPRRGGPPSPRSRTSIRKSGPRRFSPRRTARNSARFFSRAGGVGPGRAVTVRPFRRSGGKPLAAAVAPRGDDGTAALGGHAGTETVAALADKLGGLIGALHLFNTA